MPARPRRYVSDVVVLVCGHYGSKEPSIGYGSSAVYLCSTCDVWHEEQPAVPNPTQSRARVEVPGQGMLF